VGIIASAFLALGADRRPAHAGWSAGPLEWLAIAHWAFGVACLQRHVAPSHEG
jgi:hypothetical protein